MRKVITLSAVVLLIGVVMIYIWFGLINPHFSRESKALDLLPLVREEEKARSSTGANAPEFEDKHHDTLRLEEAEISLVNEENKVSWNLVMKQMTEDEEENFYLLTDIEGEYFPVTGETFQIKAEKGRMSKDFSQLELFGQVTVWRSDFNLVSKEALWSSQAGEIEFKKEVRFQRKDLEIEAELIQTDPDLEQIEIKGNSKWKFKD